MTAQSTPWHPQEMIGRHWKEGQTPEQEQILSLARDALDFVSTTGQQYPFEDFRKGLQSGRPPRNEVFSGTPEDGFASLVERMGRTEEFFTKLRDASDSAEERELLQSILDTLRFISTTRQHGAFRAC